MKGVGMGLAFLGVTFLGPCPGSGSFPVFRELPRLDCQS